MELIAKFLCGLIKCGPKVQTYLVRLVSRVLLEKNNQQKMDERKI